MEVRKKDLLYPDLSYRIIGILYDVYNELGFGYQEKYYQRAIAKALQEHNLQFKREVYLPVKYRNTKLGNFFFDFLIEEKVVLEIKQGNYFSRSNIKQVYEYLKSSNLKLGILINFTDSGIKFKRIVNIN